MQQETKKISFKFLNQLKLMIKPPQKIQQITHALVTLLSGTIASIQGNQIKSDWQSIKHCLRNTNEILEIINDSQTFQKRVRFENLEKSMLIQSQIQNEEYDETYEILSETLNQLYSFAKPLFKNLLLCQKSRNRSFQQNNTNNSRLQSQKSICNKSNVSLSQLNNSKIDRPYSQQSNLSCSRSSSNSKDYQKRVQQAQQKKQSRLDKILKLQTQKPQARSQIKSMIDGEQSLNKSYRSNSKESLMKQEIEKNQQIIKKLKLQENAIKWQIERESKRIRENQVVSQIQDEINRYKVNWEKDQKIKQEKRKNSLKQDNRKSSLKQTNLNKSNISSIQRNNSTRHDENRNTMLEQDCLFSQKQRNEREQSLTKILKTVNETKQRNNKK